MATASGIRKHTRRAVYDFIRERGMATKNEISAGLGISLPTVSKYLALFIEDGLIEEGARIASGSAGGRNAVAYRCVPDGRFAIGVDITRERVRCLVLNLRRSVIAERRTVRTFEMTEDYYAFVAAEVRAMVEEAEIDRDRILGVGIAVPGLLSETTGRVTYGRVIDNVGLSAEDFARHLPYETRLVHDSEAAGFAEFWEHRQRENAFYLSLSKSVGGSVLIKGGMYRGDGEIAGEVGHLRIHDDGLPCYCGRHGCLDPYCNATVLTRHADGSLRNFFTRLDSGDPALAEVWDRYTTDLAIAVNNIRVMFGSTIILGGDVGSRGGSHLVDLFAKVDSLSFLATPARSYLVPCTYTNHSIATGAALYLVEEFRQALGALPARPFRPTGGPVSATITEG